MLHDTSTRLNSNEIYGHLLAIFSLQEMESIQDSRISYKAGGRAKTRCCMRESNGTGECIRYVNLNQI